MMIRSFSPHFPVPIELPSFHTRRSSNLVWARRRSASRRVSNVVFMGMGEPLANYDAVWSAVERLHGAMGVSARHLTLDGKRTRLNSSHVEISYAVFCLYKEYLVR